MRDTNTDETKDPPRRARRLYALTALAAGLVLTTGLSACGSKSATAGVPGSTVSQIPVGEPFGAAKWSLDVPANSTVNVTPDRLFVTNGYKVTAWDQNGKKAWETTLPDGADLPVKVQTKTVSFTMQSHKGDNSYTVTQLANSDGHLVATNTIAGDEAYIYAAYRDSSQKANSTVYISQDGQKHALKASGTVKVIEAPSGDIPYWWSTDGLSSSSGFKVTVGDWTSDKLGFKPTDAPAVVLADNAQGLILIADSYAKQKPAMMVDARTGEQRYTADCPGGIVGNGGGDIAKDSPNGQYGITGGFLFSGSKYRCLNDLKVDKQNVSLRVVDDNGTAYATGMGGKLVAFPLEGDVTTSVLPLGANIPEGFMKNNLAINWNKDLGILTANPVKAK